MIVGVAGLMFVVASITLTGCFGGNRWHVNDQAVGTWRLVSLELKLGVFSEIIKEGDPDFGDVAGYLVLNQDGSFVDMFGTYTIYGTWGTRGGNIRFDSNIGGQAFRDEWRMTLEGDTFAKSATYAGVTSIWTYERVIV